MKSWKRLFIYLLINVVVSVAATLAVLWAWEQFRAPLPGSFLHPSQANPAGATASSKTPVPDPSVSPTPVLEQYYVYYQVKSGDTFESIAQQYNVNVDDLIAANGFPKSQQLGDGETLRIPILPITIDSVIGAGDLATERVIIHNDLDGEISLAGWRLEDGSGNVYTFPQVTIFVKGGAVNLFTKAGTNTVIDLYWGLTSSVWQSGKKVTLKDPQGKIQDTYVVP